MKIEIINHQKIKRINLKLLKSHIKKVFILLNIPSKKVSFLLCDNAFIKKLNKKYFKKSTPTDVIAFPLSDNLDSGYLGEVVVSVQKAVETSVNFNHNWQTELLIYLIHGVLHLVGYDDKTKQKSKLMDKKQQVILAAILPKNSRIILD